MYEILSDNLVRLRKSRNLTQAEFADIIKYSDKSVSKWETGTSVPSLETLVTIADFYGMTVDDLIRKPVDSEKVDSVEKIRQTNKLTIVLFAVSFVWLIAVFIFIGGFIRGAGASRWRAFIWGAPISFFVCFLFAYAWKKRYTYLFISLFFWSLISAIYLQVLKSGANDWFLFFAGIPLQVIIILSRGLRRDVIEDTASKLSQLKEKRLKKKQEKNSKENNE